MLSHRKNKPPVLPPQPGVESGELDGGRLSVSRHKSAPGALHTNPPNFTAHWALCDRSSAKPSHSEVILRDRTNWVGIIKPMVVDNQAKWGYIQGWHNSYLSLYNTPFTAQPQSHPASTEHWQRSQNSFITDLLYIITSFYGYFAYLSQIFALHEFWNVGVIHCHGFPLRLHLSGGFKSLNHFRG